MNEQNAISRTPGRADLWLAVLALGSVAGLIEVVAGGLLRDFKFPFTSGLLTGLGLAIIGIGLVIFRKPVMGIFIGLVAVLCKLLVVPILHVSVMCSANSCLAVLLEYSALSGIALIIGNRMRGRAYTRVLAGGSAALVSSITFFFIGMQVAPCNYLLAFREAGVFSFVLKEGSSWIISSAILFPLGWFVGQRLTDKILLHLTLRPRIIHSGAALTAILCWGISALGISLGL